MATLSHKKVRKTRREVGSSSSACFHMKNNTTHSTSSTGGQEDETSHKFLTKHKYEQDASIYLMALLYSLVSVFVVFWLLSETKIDVSVNTLSNPQYIIKNATVDVAKQIPPALSFALDKVIDLFGPIATFCIIVSFTYFVMRFCLRSYLNHLYFWRETHGSMKRIITLQNGSWTSTDNQINFLSSTVFTGDKLYVGFASFIYGGLVYLSQRIQIWCIIISAVQFFMFKTGKSLFPLLIFTIFMCYLFARNQLKILDKDRKINSRLIHIVHSIPLLDRYHQREDIRELHESDITRGELVPGQLVKVKVGEEIPADLVILCAFDEQDAGNDESNTDQKLLPSDSISVNHAEEIQLPERSNKKRTTFFTNEVQVTGENNPVRKTSLMQAYNHDLQRIEITDVKNRKVYLHFANGLKRAVDETEMAFANSTLISNQPNLVIIGLAILVSTETKALSTPSSAGKQSSPFTEYTAKGFLLSLFAMLSFAIINAITSYFNIDAMLLGDHDDSEHNSKHSVSFGAVMVNHIMYLNMMVPQALEQLRFFVCALLSSNFEKDVKCNDSLMVDVLGYTTRIVSDKTGTLTQNKMEAIATMIFKDQKFESSSDCTLENGCIMMDYHDEDHPIDYDSLVKSQEDTLITNAMAILSTTGMEPEELAIASCISPYTKVQNFEPSDPDDRHPGSVTFTIAGETHHLSLFCLGFKRSLLSKTVIARDDRTGEYFVAVQAGGDEFWRNIIKSLNVEDKFDVWKEKTQKYQKCNGAPRVWSHGWKKIDTKQYAEQLLESWYSTFVVDEPEEREMQQKKIILEALEGINLVSKTFMVDKYRDGVAEGIKALVKEGKQFFICTGDSIEASILISKQLQFPSQHIIVNGKSEETIMESLQSILHFPDPCTIFFDQQCMEQLRDIENRDPYGETIETLLSILEKKKKKGRFLHYGVFCRATPKLKPWVVQLMQKRHKKTLLDPLLGTPYRVIAVGDGANDVNMLKIADVSLGIKSGETLDVCSQASFYSSDWKPLVNMLLRDGPQKSYSIAMMIKLVFLKHWMTAFALLAQLIFTKFPLFPKEPTDPILMMIYNAVVFTQIASHTISDVIENQKNVRHQHPFSFRAFMRWGIGAALSGFAITFIVRWLFADVPPENFGAMIQVAQAVSVTIFLYLSTNLWTDDQDKYRSAQHGTSTPHKVNKKLSIIYGGAISTVTAICATIYIAKFAEITTLGKILSIITVFAFAGYPSTIFFANFNQDFYKVKKHVLSFFRMPTDQFVSQFISWSHTKHGRIIPVIMFLFIAKLGSGVQLFSLALVSALVSAISALIFLFFVSRFGFLRALFDGKSAAVGFICLLVGFLAGRYSALQSL